MDSTGIPDWDRVSRLESAILNVGEFVTNAEVESIACLYADLSEYDWKALTFAPHFKKGKGRFQQLKNRSRHIGVEWMARYYS